jgi:hypothetical protein
MLLISVWIIIYYKNDAKNVLDYLVENASRSRCETHLRNTGDSLIL